jgi:hypothetical protein
VVVYGCRLAFSNELRTFCGPIPRHVRSAAAAMPSRTNAEGDKDVFARGGLAGSWGPNDPSSGQSRGRSRPRSVLVAGEPRGTDAEGGGVASSDAGAVVAVVQGGELRLVGSPLGLHPPVPITEKW